MSDSPAPPPCPLCRAPAPEVWAHATDLEYFTTAETFAFHRCAACDVLFLHPMPLGRLGTIYPASYYSFGGGAGGGLASRVKEALDQRAFRRFLGAVAGDDLAVLDVGGGSGFVLGAVRAAEPRVRTTQVVDIDPGAEAVARAAGHGYFCGPIEAFVPERTFDAVLLLNLIEHVADPLAVLAAVRGLVAPGGRVLVKTPNTDAWDARLFRHANWGGYHCPRHWVLFTRASFTALAARAGFAVARFGYTQGAPFWATSVLFALHRRGWIRLDAAHPAVRHPLFTPLAIAFAALDFARMPFARPSQMVFELVPA